jgi:hypothetical protein
MSLILEEADDVSILTETPSADIHVVFADETLTSSTNSTGSTVLAVSTGMGSPKKVRHCLWKL